MMRERIGVVGLALVALLVPTQAQAGLLTFTPLAANQQYQQTTNNPCVIGENSCQQPNGFLHTVLAAGSANSYDATSPGYTVAQLQALFGNAFYMGFDINQATGQGVQSLSYFDMQINTGSGFNVIDSVTFNPAQLFGPTPGGGNGNGYADYIISGFTSLATYAPTDLVRFRAVLPSVNDGAEQFFLIDAQDPPTGCPPNCPPPPPPPPPPVPEPATLMLYGLGLLGVAYKRRRR